MTMASLASGTPRRAFRGRRHDLVRKPDAGNPHVRFDERGPGNAVMRAGLRPGAKAPESPPDSKTGAPAPDSTRMARPAMAIDDGIVAYRVAA